MPNLLDATGLQTVSQTEQLTAFQTALAAIYGANINLSSATPDGQMAAIYTQALVDLGDLLQSIFSSFDPDAAFGVALDQRVAINGIQRQAGTYSTTPVSITTSQVVNLYGLDQTANQVFTVADNAGNQWQLITTVLGLAAGTSALMFQAATPGQQLTIPGTIVVPVTIVLGVTSFTNPTVQAIIGVNEETDAQLKVRRQKSVNLATQGFLAGLRAALQNITGMGSAFVYENTGGSTNSDGVPGHSIWVIVSGTAAASDIANAIYTKRNAGCGMYGAQSYTITQADGSAFTVYWDNVITRPLYIAFTASSINGVTPPNIQAIQAGLSALFVPGVYAEVNVNSLATYVQQIDPNCLVTNAGFSTGSVQTISLSGVPASGTFALTYGGVTTAAINWNDSLATIQADVQAVSGLSSATVTGSLASQTLTITIPGSVATLIGVTSSSLQTSGAAYITYTFTEGYTSTLTPISKQNQFVVTPADIIILPMQIKQSATSVAHGGSATFAAYGGYLTPTFLIVTNNSGGAISSSGTYVAGATGGGVVDTIRATDSLGNTATATITVN